MALDANTGDVVNPTGANTGEVAASQDANTQGAVNPEPTYSVDELIEQVSSGANLSGYKFAEESPAEPAQPQEEPAEPAQEGEVADPKTKEPENFISFKTKDDYQAEVDRIVGDRLKANRLEVEDYRKIKPEYDRLMDTIAKTYSTTPEYAAALYNDLIRMQAESRQLPEDVIRSQIEADNLRKYYEAETQRMQANQQQQAYIEGLTRQAAEFTAKNPAFSMDNEVNNPAFTDLLAKGVPVEMAYNAIHAEDIRQAAAKEAAKAAEKAVVKSVATNQGRIPENGTIPGQGANAAKTKLTDDEIDRMIERSRMGERVLLE